MDSRRPHKIRDSFKQFYKNFHTAENICPTIPDQFLQYPEPLKDTDKTDLETPFSLKETLIKIKFNKTPGVDGHTA